MKFHFFYVLVVTGLLQACFAERDASSQGRSSDDISAHDLDVALKVDAQSLEIVNLAAVNQPIPTRSYSDFTPHNVVVEVAANTPTLYVSIEICDDAGENCTEHFPAGSTLVVDSASLSSENLRIIARPCTLKRYASSAEICGAPHQIQHSLPAKALDTQLQMLEQQRNDLRARLAYWDPLIPEMLEDYQKDIDECVKNNKKFMEIENVRSLVNMGIGIVGAMGGGRGTQPSQLAVGQSSSSKEDIDLLTLRSSFGDAKASSEKAKSLYKKGYPAASLYYAYMAGREAYRTGQQVKKVVDSVREFLSSGAQLSDLFTSPFMGRAVNFFLPEPQGSVVGFGMKAANAIYDLSATHVLLPCGQRQLSKDMVGSTFDKVRSETLSLQCLLDYQVRQRREHLKLQVPPSSDLCTDEGGVATQKEEEKKDDKKDEGGGG